MPTMTLESAAFVDNEPLPAKYTGEGENLSPPLQWSNVPDGTRQFAIVCTDRNGPGGLHWVHWILYNLPLGLRELPEGLVFGETNCEEVNGVCQGKNSWDVGRTIGYRGPLPHSGTGVHRYRFSIYALDTELNMAAGADKSSLMSAMDGHVLARADLIGTYER